MVTDSKQQAFDMRIRELALKARDDYTGAQDQLTKIAKELRIDSDAYDTWEQLGEAIITENAIASRLDAAPSDATAKINAAIEYLSKVNHQNISNEVRAKLIKLLSPPIALGETYRDPVTTFVGTVTYIPSATTGAPWVILKGPRRGANSPEVEWPVAIDNLVRVNVR